MDDLEKYYKTLGLEPGASLEEVKEAYRDLAKVWHPDRFAEDDRRLREKAQARTREIVKAYEGLMAHLPGAVAGPGPDAPGGRESRGAGSPGAQEHSFHDYPRPRTKGPGPGWLLKGFFVLALLAAGMVAVVKMVDLRVEKYLKKEVPEKAAEAAEDLFGMFSAQEPGPAGPPAIPGGSVRVGMTAEQVEALQGEPDRIDRYSIGEVWWYGKSSVKFKEGMVAALKDRGELGPGAKEKTEAQEENRRLYQYRGQNGRIIITDTPREGK